MMENTVQLMVLIDVQEGKAQEQIDAYNALKPLVLAEPGCLQYQLQQVVDKPEQFILLEQWESTAALAAHDVTPHMVAADAHSPSFRAKPATVVSLIDV